MLTLLHKHFSLYGELTTLRVKSSKMINLTQNEIKIVEGN